MHGLSTISRINAESPVSTRTELNALLRRTDECDARIQAVRNAHQPTCAQSYDLRTVVDSATRAIATARAAVYSTRSEPGSSWRGLLDLVAQAEQLTVDCEVISDEETIISTLRRAANRRR